MIVFEPLHPAPRLPVGSGHALQPGERLEDFEISQVLGLTSFGVIYLAQDLAQRRAMAIKEYLPVTIAARNEDGRVELRDAMHEEAFQRGLQSFITEALTLSQFDHPHLLRIACVWEGNGTAYRAMPHYGGTSLLARRFSSKKPPSEAALRDMLRGLAGALHVLHDAGLSHGQVEPMNIMVLDDGRAMLLDFDAARHAILSDPKLPFVDAYADSDRLAESRMSDLHALAAVLHFAISGQWSPLPPGASRVHEPLATVVARLGDNAPEQAYDPAFLSAIDTALARAPGERPGSVAQFLALFDTEAERTVPVAVARPVAEAIDLPLEDSPAVDVVAATGSDAPAEPPVIPTADLPRPPIAVPAPPPAPAAHAQVVPQPRLKRIQPRVIPERTVHEYPLNSSESVLELLAGFGRNQPDPDDVEPFESPALPTLTEEAEPALPPLRESLFDKIDAGESVPGGLGYGGRADPHAMPPAPRRWWRIALWCGALVVVAVGAIGIRWG